MRRRDFLSAVGTSVVAGSSMAYARHTTAAVESEGEARKPDVLFLLTDQWNPRCLGYAGDSDVRTPHIDRMAAEGMVFENNYTPCPVCMPARAALLTGMYPHNFGSWTNAASYFLTPELGKMFQDIRDAGYSTAQIGKLHWTSGPLWNRYFDSLDSYYRALGLTYCLDVATPNSTPNGHGVYQDYIKKIGRMDAYCRDIAGRMATDEYDPHPAAVAPEEHNDWFVADRAIDFIKAQPKDRPYCMVVSFPGPHPPLDAPGRYASLISPDSISLPRNAPERFSYRESKHDVASQRAMRANYYGKMALIDDCVGRLMGTLKERGTLDDTLVVFSADHGEMMGAHGHMSKGRFYEESGRVPLVMRWPKQIAAGTRTTALSHLFDLHPTFVEAAGGKLSPNVMARSLLPVATQAAPRVWDEVHSEIGRDLPMNYMLRTERHVWWTHTGKEALYDMIDDPWQQRNLIGERGHRSTVEEMHSRHWKYLKDTQINLAVGGKPMLDRIAEENGGRDENLAERLYQKFRKSQGLD